MKKKHRKIFLELILLFSGVFVFRSLWTLMDKIYFFNQNYVHITLLMIGTFFTIFAIHKYKK